YNVLTNAGTVNWGLCGVSLYYYTPAQYSGSIYNLAGALWDIQADRTMSGGYGNEFFNNSGFVRKSVGTGTSTVGIAVTNNSGTLDLQSGTVNFSVNSGYKQAGATLNFGLG